MSKKLNCVILIDDDEPTNFLHRRVIERYGCAERIEVFQEAQLALDFLHTTENGVFVRPELIFLDINMPGMNGWEFLMAYEELSEEQRADIVVLMLTTSLNPDDKAQAESFEEVCGFLSKPLTKELLKEILEKHFGW
jgi:CheY-like chemotaxis protein